MRRLLIILLLLGPLLAFAADGLTGGGVKVLPLFRNLKGHDVISSSHFDRDACQFYQHQHTNEVSADRFDVLWKTSNAKNSKLKLRTELCDGGAGGLPEQTVLETPLTPGFFRSWTPLTLWSGDDLLGEQKSFLW
jgi:hypothetical protein